MEILIIERGIQSIGESSFAPFKILTQGQRASEEAAYWNKMTPYTHRVARYKRIGIESTPQTAPRTRNP